MSVRVCGLKIDAQTDSCELPFVGVGVLMRTIVQDTGLRNCSKYIVWICIIYPHIHILNILLLFSHSVVSDSFATPWTIAH